MARLPRLAVPGLPHLVVMPGHSGQPVFVDDDDRRAFLAALREAALQQRVAVHAYTLLPTEVLLLLTPAADGPAAALGALMQGLGRRYGAAFNRRHGRSGSLWAGRFRTTVVQPGPALLEVLLLVDGQASRLGLAATAGDHRFSSARHHLGLERDGLITPCAAWWALGNTPFERELAYQRVLAEGLPAERARALAEAAHKGWAIGDAGFLAALVASTQRPVQPRARGRPPGAAAATGAARGRNGTA